MVVQDEELKHFSKKMCQAIENQVDINCAIKELVKKSLKDDVDIEDTIKSIIDKHTVYKLDLWLPTIVSSIVCVLSLLIYWFK
jgi:hypothetical protein